MHIKSPILLVVVVTGCAARQPPPQYVRAVPEKDSPRQPAVIEVPKPMPIPGQLRRVPGHDVKRAEKQSPSDVIADANRKAALGPDREGYFNAIMTYDFAEGALFQVYAAPLRLTTIQLQPGEKLVGKPAAGDTIRWVMGIGRSGRPTPAGNSAECLPDIAQSSKPIPYGHPSLIGRNLPMIADAFVSSGPRIGKPGTLGHSPFGQHVRHATFNENGHKIVVDPVHRLTDE